MRRNLRYLITTVMILAGVKHAIAQDIDKRTQFSRVLSNSYYSANIGYIDYPFPHSHIPHAAVRLILYGRQFGKHWSGQITYMRPVQWVSYQNVNGDQTWHSLFLSYGGLTATYQFSLSKKFSIYGEAGLGIVSRSGFYVNQVAVITDAVYGTLLTGGGLLYHLNTRWDLDIAAVYSPANKKIQQPNTAFYSGGFIYRMRPLPERELARNGKSGYIFPRNLIQAGISSNVWGYDVNKFFAKGIFWGGEVEVKNGFAIDYQRNVFHGRKAFSLDWGAGMGWWNSRQQSDKFFTLSVFPMLRFWAFRLKPLDIYFNYSVAGPTYISKLIIDGHETGKHFTFRDFMGMGIFAGEKRNFNAELKIGHYSNGNVFTRNPGIKIPLTFTAGYAF